MKIIITGQKRKLRITGLPKADLGQQVTDIPGDDPENEAWIRKLMEYEAGHGFASGKGMPNWGFNSRIPLTEEGTLQNPNNPTTGKPWAIEDAMEFYKQDILPKVQQYPMGMRERAGDFLYNTGRDPRVYMLDQYLQSTGQSGLPNRSSYNVDTKTSKWTPELQKSLDEQWNTYKDKIETLPLDQRTSLLDKGRDFYYQNIDKVDGKPNPAYEKTWKGRVDLWGKPTSTTVPTIGGTKDVNTNTITTPAAPAPTAAPKVTPAGVPLAPTQVPSAGAVNPPTDYSKEINDLSTSWMGPKAEADATLPKRPFEPAQTIPFNTSTNNGITSPTSITAPTNTANQSKITGKVPTPPASTAPTSVFEQAGANMDNYNAIVGGVQKLTDTAGVIGQFIGDRNKQKDYDKWARQQRYNSAAVVPASRSGVHGNYSVTGSSYGAFRQPEQGFTNEGRYMNNPGMKIRAFGGAIEDALEMPIEYVDVDKLMQDRPAQQTIEQPEAFSTETESRQTPPSGTNPLAETTWKEYSTKYKGIKNLGIWGDEAHKKTKSDHNTGDALDLGITDLNQGSEIAQNLIDEAKDKNVKYIIFNNKIWNPSISNDWRPYTGKDPHTGHVHISFNRSADQATDETTPTNWDHNNPGNIHFGDFASNYGATKGRKDGDGYVAIFPDAQTGLKAMDDLLFNPEGTYYNKTIADARTTYVGLPTQSSRAIVSAMGGNKKLSDLSPEERKKLKQEFVKWEDRNVYNAYRKNGYFETGGTVGGSVTCSNCGHSWTTESSDPSDVTTCHKCGFNNNTINNDMKIRITGGPKQMAYGGQSGYGFDLGQRNTYSAMSQDPYEDASKTLGPVDREDANIEAEKGETVYGDLNNDGHNEHMIIGGKKHTQGGTPLNVPEGSFIFSDTKKMKIKDPEVLKYFGLTARKDGYTPAEIAKRYDVNKYKGILQDPYADAIKKKTASLMIESYEKKLGYLALIQESMKGFPQGIPKIAEEVMGGGGQQAPQQGAAPQEQQAPPQQGPQEEMMEGPEGQNPQEEGMEEMPPMQMYGGAYDFGGAYIPEYEYAYGGMPQYALAGTVDPGKKKKYKVKTNQEIEAEYRDRKNIPAEYKPYENIKDLYWKQTPGTPGRAGLKHKGRITQAWLNASPEQRKAMSAREQQKFEEKNPDAQAVPATPGTEDYLYTEDQPVKEQGDRWRCTPQGVVQVSPTAIAEPGVVYYNSLEEAEKVCTKVPNKGPRWICEDNVVKEAPEGADSVGYATKEEAQASCTPAKTKQQGFGMPPRFNAAAAIGPKKYDSWAAKLEQYMPNPTFLSPDQELAQNAGIATSMARGFTGSPQQYAAMANAAQLNAIGNAANIIGKVSNQNVGIANQFSPLQAGIMNDMMKYDANRQDVLHQNKNMYDKEYRNSLRTYLHNYVDVPNKADYEYVTKRNIMNASNPYYNLIDRPGGGNLMLKPGANAYSTVTGRAAAPAGGMDATTTNKYIARVNALKTSGLDSRQMAPILATEFPSMRSGTASRGTNQQAAASQYMNMFPGAGYQYPANYDDGD